MPLPIGSLGPLGGPHRIRRRGVAGAAAPGAQDPVQAPSGPEAPAPIPPIAGPPEDALSAHLMGQAGSAEGAADPANSARQAHSTYMAVEWSGPQDRRTRRGRIAKTEI